jgi:heat shock protein HslJ
MKTARYFLLFVVTAVLAVGLPSRQSLAQEELACESDVIVQEGDWLSTIAEQAYGDPALYEAIAFATNLKAQSDSRYATIDNHDIIEPGWKLCLPAQAVAEALQVSAPVGTSVLTVEALMNATYSGIYEEPVTLTDGLYEGEPYVEGDPSRPTVEYINGSELYGDLDGDGVEDAAVFLLERGGGTGAFTYVAAQLNQNGQPVDAGAVWIEDRIQVKSAAIENGQVVLEIITQGPGDGACCPSYKARKTYALQEGRLAEIAGEDGDLERISAADLNGTSWTLLELNYDQPSLTESAVTISFMDGQITGSGGCNNYNSSFSLGEDNPLVMTVSPVVATRKACPEPILNQETAYFSALENASQWGYVIGRLALYYADDQAGLGRMLFAPAGAETSQVDLLTASAWQWVGFTDPMQQFEVDQPENYILTFQPDGTLQIKADCNQVIAAYSASDDGTLSIQPGPATMAACPPGSRGEELVQKLGFAARYFFQDGNVFIDMMADGGTLELAPGL